jgi:sec-independent protein translocase protein TatA
MFGIGTQELIIILVIAFLVFGAKALPDLGKSLGQSINSFKKAIEGKAGEEENPEGRPGESKPKNN